MEKETLLDRLTPEQQALAARLTPLQLNFVLCFVSENISLREAYVKAGGRSKNDNSRDACASRMFSYEPVQDLYSSLIKSAASNAIINKEQYINKLVAASNANASDVYTTTKIIKTDENGVVSESIVYTQKPLDQIPRAAQDRCKFRMQSNGTYAIELQPAIETDREIGKAMSFNNPKHDDSQHKIDRIEWVTPETSQATTEDKPVSTTEDSSQEMVSSVVQSNPTTKTNPNRPQHVQEAIDRGMVVIDLDGSRVSN